MAEEARDSETRKKDAKGLAHDIESQIKGAMRSRVAHFKEQADSLTFEGVRRLLEKDLWLETYALDVHKRLIKQCLLECLDGADSDNASKTSGEMGEKSVTREVADSSEGLHSKKDVKDSEDSPVMGLLTGHKTTKAEHEETKASENKEVPSESAIKKAIRKRASYIKANSEKVTMAGLRRLLEEDLELKEYTLDSYKKFISQQLDDVLQSREFSEEKPASNVKKNVKKNSDRKASKRVSSEESSDSSHSEDDEEEEEMKPRKKSVPKGKMQNSDVKKRGRPVKETNIASSKRRKAAETISEENTDAEDGGNVSEDGHSESSEEKPVKKKDVSNPAYGKHVEQLKSVIKSCGMSVPPSTYKKVKHVPENKREAHLIKELEEILSKEGLSTNPSEKEIKEVRKRKERAKELEGIDMSNIVQSSRRRSTASFVAPPKPKIPVERDGDDAEETEKGDDDDGDDNKVVEEEEEEEDNDDDDDDDDEADDSGDDDDSQSEEFNEDADEDSD